MIIQSNTRPRGRPANSAAQVGKRRARYIAAAIALFGQNGFHATTMGDVARRAGSSVGLVYQYFADKEDLLHAAIAEVLDAYEREIPAALAGKTDPLARLRAAVRAFCAVIDAYRDAALLAYREYRALSKTRQRAVMRRELATNAVIRRCVEACVKSGAIRRVDAAFLTYHVVVFVHAWALGAWRLDRRMDPLSYADRGLDLLLQLPPDGDAPRRRPKRKASST